MPNKSLFDSTRAAIPVADTKNDAGGRAYQLKPKEALAQLVLTGTFNGTFYATAKDQLDRVMAQLPNVDAEFIAKLAVYARTEGFMKDTPAFLTAYLAINHRDRKDLLRAIFPVVIDNGKMLRNFVAFIQSGVFGKRSFPRETHRLLKAWFASRRGDQIFWASVGNDPSMRDMLRLIHAKPTGQEQDALFAYLVGKKYRTENLPPLVRQFELFKKDPATVEVPKVPFQLITGIDGIPTDVWKGIARNAKWQMTRMNLNTFARHGVFDDPAMVKMIAARLANAELVHEARQFPYQLYTAYQNITGKVPAVVKDALHDAMEAALVNVPEIEGDVVIAVDTSGSMTSGRITGTRKGSSTSVRCIDAAGLFASALLRRNRSARVIPFAGDVHRCTLEPRDTVMTNTEKLVRLGGGATACSAPLALLNREKAKVDAVIFVSDYESWIDGEVARSYRDGGTAMMREWTTLRRRNKGAKLVCIDLTPRTNHQVQKRPGILNVGGFSDQVFKVTSDFLNSPSENAWVKRIESVKLQAPVAASNEEPDLEVDE
jgi:60 kDa SS-A/Ro ribonucleoprotein